MRPVISVLFLTLLLSVTAQAPAQQPLYGSRLEASKFTNQDIPELVRKAEAGDPKAQLLLGHAYKYGYGTGRKDSESVKWYRLASDQGTAEAQYFLAYAYQFGQGVGKDKNEAMKWYLRSAEQGFAGAQTNLGSLYHQEKNYIEGVKWDRKAAEAGEYLGQVNLSKDYALGTGLSQDYPAAYLWLLLARAAPCGEPPKLCVELDPVVDADTQGLKNSIADHLSPGQIAEARGKASEWLVAHQMDPLPPQAAEPQREVFLVAHKHGGSGFLARSLSGGLSEAFDNCHGWITITKEQIKYVSENGKCTFGFPPSELKKVGTHARTEGFSLLVDVTLALSDGKKYTLVPVDDQGQRVAPAPLVKALKSVTGQ